MSHLDLRLRRPLAEERHLFVGCRHRRCLVNTLGADFLLWSNAQAPGLLQPGPDSLPLAAVLPDGRVCGVVEFQEWDRVNQNARLCCDVLDSSNRGLTPHLLRAAADYALADRGLVRIYGCQPEPDGWAREAAAAAGFKTEGELAEAHFTGGRHVGLAVLGRLNEGRSSRHREDPLPLAGTEGVAAAGGPGEWRAYRPEDFAPVLRWFLEDDFYLRAQHPTSVPEDRVRKLVEGHSGRTLVYAGGEGIEGIGIVLAVDDFARVARLEARFPQSVDDGRATCRLGALARQCLEAVNLHRLQAQVYGFDRRGQAWYAGAGFRLEAVLPNHVYRDARYWDVGVYGRVGGLPQPAVGGGEG